MTRQWIWAMIRPACYAYKMQQRIWDMYLGRNRDRERLEELKVIATKMKGGSK